MPQPAPANPKTAVQEKWSTRFYWIGVVSSGLCVALALARNTDLAARFDHSNFPLAWAAGVIAILAFLAWEYFYPAPPPKKRIIQRVPEMPREAPQWETEFAD